MASRQDTAANSSSRSSGGICLPGRLIEDDRDANMGESRLLSMFYFDLFSTHATKLLSSTCFEAVDDGDSKA